MNAAADPFALQLSGARAAAEAEEQARLAPWAQRSAESRGRLSAEPEHPYRTAFARDRDRILHSKAFRRLQYKTQVFVRHEGDSFRNRLTHTLEAAQIARTLARALRANAGLAEAIALAHDMGHTPFGHAGGRELNSLMRGRGGFEHNRQTLRIVDWLENHYPKFRGLNLTWETREGILKHGCNWSHPVELPALQKQPSLEAQLADCADEIAYLNHDLDDGLRAGLLAPAALSQCELWAQARAECEAQIGAGARESVLRAQIIVRMINRLVTDLCENTLAALRAQRPQSADQVRALNARLAQYSPETARQKTQLKRHLRENLYAHPRVTGPTEIAVQAVGALFRAYRAEPELLPAHVRARAGAEGLVRATADYIAGMTDRFAQAEHAKLSGKTGA